MILTGTFINGGAILLGTFFGLFIRKIPDRFKDTATAGVALAILLIGLQMAFQVNNLILILLSLMLGGVLGEWLNLEGAFNKIGTKVAYYVNKDQQDSRIAQGFITASMIFVVGAMAIIGALNSGLNNDHTVLITKSMLDGFTALVLSATLGIGVGLSAIPVVLYQGSLAILAQLIQSSIPHALLDRLINETTAIGGLLIVAIGLNMLGLTKIRIANLIPTIMIVGLLVTADYLIN